MTDKQKTLNKLSIELYKTEGKKVEQLAEEVDKEQEKLDLIKKQALTDAGSSARNIKKVQSAQKNIEKAYDVYQGKIKGIEDSDNAKDLADRNKAYNKYQEKILTAAVKGAGDNDKVLDDLLAYGNGLDSLREKTDNYNSAQNKVTADGKKLAEGFNNQKLSALNYGQAILSAASIIGGVVTAINSVKSVWETITDPDLSG